MITADTVCLGDSIAVGLSSFLRCTPMAQVGRNSTQQLALIQPINAKTVVISLGSNDPYNDNLAANLERIRSQITARTVIWIIPYNNRAGLAVRRVAGSFRDGLLDLHNFSTRDGVHPRSYQTLAKELMSN